MSHLYRKRDDSKTDIYKNQVPSKLSVKDELTLEGFDLPDVSKFDFPEDTNEYLRNQILNLSRENKTLQNGIEEKETVIKNQDRKISQLNIKLNQYESLKNDANGLCRSSSSLTSSKIVELSKKIRELTAECEIYKSRCVKYENTIKQYEIENEKKSNDVQIKEKNKDPNSIKILNEKLSVTSNKLYEIKNINTKLKNDLKLANKLLSQEIGESFSSIQNLTSSNSNWRGRAQLIITLQQKVQDLQEKLSTKSVDRHSTNTLKLMEMKKRQIQEQMYHELEDTKTELESAKRKVDIAKTRSRVLENESSNLRSKLATLFEKSDHDDQLISALTGQLSAIEESQKIKLKECFSSKNQFESEIATLKNDANVERQKQEKLKKILEERDEQITDLKKKLKKMQDNVIFSDLQLDHNKEYHTLKIKDKSVQTIYEADKKRLLDLINALNVRLENERGIVIEQKLKLKKEQQENNKLKTKVEQMVLEKNMSKSSLYSRSCKSINANLEVCINPNENLKFELELTEEKLLLLQDKLNTLEYERKIDLENYQNNVESLKNLFNEQLENIKIGIK